MYVVVFSPTACIPYHVFSILSRVIFNYLKLSLVFCVSESIISDSQINLPQTHMAVNTFFQKLTHFFEPIFLNLFELFYDPVFCMLRVYPYSFWAYAELSLCQCPITSHFGLKSPF